MTSSFCCSHRGLKLQPCTINKSTVTTVNSYNSHKLQSDRYSYRYTCRYSSQAARPGIAIPKIQDTRQFTQSVIFQMQIYADPLRDRPNGKPENDRDREIEREQAIPIPIAIEHDWHDATLKIQWQCQRRNCNCNCN